MYCKSLLLSLFIFTLFSPALVQAQTNNSLIAPPSAHQMANEKPLTVSPSIDEYLAANNKMLKDKVIKLIVNADPDF